MCSQGSSEAKKQENRRNGKQQTSSELHESPLRGKVCVSIMVTISRSNKLTAHNSSCWRGGGLICFIRCQIMWFNWYLDEDVCAGTPEIYAGVEARKLSCLFLSLSFKDETRPRHILQIFSKSSARRHFERNASRVRSGNTLFLRFDQNGCTSVICQQEMILAFNLSYFQSDGDSFRAAAHANRAPSQAEKRLIM